MKQCIKYKVIEFKKMYFCLVDSRPKQKSLRKFHWIVNNNSTVNKIPIRATILSALSSVPYMLLLAAVHSSGLKKNDIAMETHIVVQVCNYIYFKRTQRQTFSL